MISERASALIISKKGSLRDGLAALLDAIPHVGLVYTADSLDEAMQPSEPARKPALIVLDARSVGADMWLAVRRAKARWPAGRCIVLADNVDQQEEAEAAGADAVLINGFPPARLDAALARLLPRCDDEDVPVCISRRAKGRATSGAADPPRHATTPRQGDARRRLARGVYDNRS